MQADMFNTPESLPSNPLHFDFEGHDVRVIDRGGNPWWALVDVCKSLGIKNPSDAASRLEADERMTLGITEGHSGQRGGARFMTLINESGAYALIFSSNKPAAIRFRKWITSVVIPSIRRTGSFHVSPAPIPSAAPPMPPALAEQALAVIGGLQALVAEQQALAQERLETIQHQSALLSHNMPKAVVHDRILELDGTLTLSDAAKSLGVPPRKLIQFLSASRWIFRRGQKSPWIAQQPRLNSGLLTHKVSTVIGSDGTDKIVEQVRVTAKGIARLARIVPAEINEDALARATFSSRSDVGTVRRIQDGGRAYH